MTDYLIEKYKLSHRLLGVSQSLEDQIGDSLNGALETVTAKILILSQKAEQTESLTRRKQYLEKQKSEIEKVLNEVYADIGKTIKDSAVEVGLETPELVNTIAKRTLKIKFAVPHFDKKTVTAWFESSQVEGLYFNKYLKKLRENATARIIKEARQAIILTGTGNKSVKRVQDALNVSQRSAAGLVENAISTMHNWAELETYKENSDIIGKVRFSALLDRHTSIICRELSGQIFDFKNAPVPPLHWRCRSSLVPVYREERIEKIEGTQIARIELNRDSRVIRHRDETTSTKHEKLRVQDVSDQMTYNDWMKSLIKSSNPEDVAFAKEVLGPTRFEIVASGKLKMESLYYHGKLRNIKELKELMK